MRCLIELFSLWIFWVSSLFSDCEQNILHHWRKNFRKVVKGAFYLNNKLFQESLFSEENFYFYKFFEFWWKTLRTSVGKISTRIWKLLSTPVQGIFLHNIIIFLEKNYPYYRTLRENGWNFVNFYWHGGQNCFLFVQRTFLKKYFSFSQNLQNFQLFSDFEENIRIFGENNLVGLSKLFSSVQGLFLEEFFLENKFLDLFFISGLRAQFFWTFGENFAIGLWKLHSMCPVEIFDWTVYSTKSYEFFTVFGPWGKNSGILARKLQKVCQKSNLCVQKNSVENLIFEKTFTIFSSTDQNFCDFWQKCRVIEKFWVRLYFSSDKIHVFLRKLREKVFGVRYELQAGSLKLHFMCPNENFERSVFSMNFLSLFTVFRLWAEISATLTQKIQRGCQKCILLEQQNFLRKVWFLKNINTFTIFSSFDEKLCRILPESLPPALKNCFLHSSSGSSCITWSLSSRKLTPTNGFWGKIFGNF